MQSQTDVMDTHNFTNDEEGKLKDREDNIHGLLKVSTKTHHTVLYTD